eukprot:COSAG06_NODE_6454_length_2925_cov_3.208776_3_plen_84_part_00
MFVPSLSWQNDAFYILKNGAKMAFLYLPSMQGVPPAYLLSQCGKTVFLSHLYIKTNILPRQALDKHRENSKKRQCSVVSRRET